MRLRRVLFCSLLVLAAGPAVAVERSPRARGWVRASDAARSVAAIEGARQVAGPARATRAPAVTRSSGDPRPGVLGTIAWTAGGVPVCPAGIGDQFDPTAVSDAAGGVVAAWIDTRQSGFDVYAARLDGNGNPLWSPNGVALCASDSIMIQPLSVPDGSGGAFVVWGQFSGSAFSNVLVQHVTALGTIAAGWPANGRSTVPGGADGFGVIPTNDGFLLMGWVDTAGQIRVLRLTGAGGLAPGWAAAGHAVGSSGNFFADVSATTDGAGGGYLCWDESGTAVVTRIGSGGIFPSGWSAAGTPISATALSSGLGVAPIPGGDVMVFWPDIRNFNLDVFAQRYTAAGAIEAGWPADGALVMGGSVSEDLQEAVPDGAGGAVVMCHVGFSDSLVAQRMTGAGARAAGWPAAGVTIAREPGKTPSNVIADGLGGALIAWNAIGQTLENDVFASRAAPGGTVAVGWPDTICNVAGNQYDPVIVTDGAAGLIAVWEDGRDLGAQNQLIFAARVTFDGAVGTLASLVSASAEPGIARLHWYTGGGAAFEAGLERARGEGAFVEIARVTAEAGHVRYDDRDVIGGETYRYRLAVLEGGTVRHQGAVTLRVPAGLSLSLTGFVPNPVAGSPRLVYALPAAAPARIEVLDLAGRRVHERALDSTAGEHIVAFDGAALAPGVYVLRLTQGTRSVTARAVVVR